MVSPKQDGATRKRRDVFADRYARCRDKLSPSLKRVAAFIDTHRIDVMTLSAIDLARAIGTSDATVVRTVQALGFDGLADLRRELTHFQKGRNAPADNFSRTLSDVGESAEVAMNSVLETLTPAIASLNGEAMRRNITQALKLLHVANRIVVFGQGPTAHVAAYFAARLRRKGRKEAVIDRAGTQLADQLLGLEEGDALLMLAYGHPYREAEATMFEAHRLQIPIVLITDAAKEGLPRHANVVLNVPRGRSGRIALHGATLVCLEMLLLGLATSARETAAGSLEQLDRLRDMTRSTARTRQPAKASARTTIDSDDDR